MMQFRTVGLVGSINHELEEDVMDRLLELQLRSNDPINLIINSPGGAGDLAMRLHDIISFVLTAPVHALVVGRCNSAATFVLLGCKVRRGMPHAEFVIHSGTFSGFSLKVNEVSLANAPRLFTEIKRSAQAMVDFYAEKLEIPKKRVRALIARGDEQFDSSMNANEAFEIGLITEIVKANIGIFRVS